MAKRLYTYDDIMKLPDFIRVGLLDGVICTDDWTDLELTRMFFRIHHPRIIMLPTGFLSSKSNCTGSRRVLFCNMGK